MRFLLLPLFLFIGMICRGQGEAVPSPLTDFKDEKAFIEACEELTHTIRNQPSAALNIGHSLLAIGKQKNWFLGHAWLNQALASWYMGDYANSIEFFRAALDVFGRRQDMLGMAHAWQGLGMAEWRLGNFAGANKYLFESFKLRESESDSLGLMDSYYWLGIIQADLSDYEGARNYYDKSLVIAQQLRNRQREADIFNVIGRSWRKEKAYEQALEAHAVSVQIYREIGDSLGISDYYNNVGSVYRRQGKFDQALAHFYSALSIQERLEDKEGLADGYNDIGTTLMQMGEFEEAIKYLEQGLQSAREIQLLDDVRYAYQSLAAVYDSMRNYQSAFDYHQLYTAVKDSIYDLRNRDMINQQRFDYEWEKAAQERSQREVRVRQQVRTALLIIFSLFALAGGAAAFFFWQNRVNARTNRQLAAKNTLIDLERDRAQKLLLNILPEEIAEELKYSASGRVKARSYDSVSVMFIDFKGFTRISEILTPRELVNELHHCFMHFDRIVDAHGLEKIKTIGDAYLCAGGLPVVDPMHARKTVKAAMDIQQFMARYKSEREAENLPFFEARIGIHSGQIVAGVVGTQKFAYDIWGDTVNTAARLESASEVGKVNISSDTFKLVKDVCVCEYRGKIPAKNKGEIDMYFVEWTM